MPFAGMGLRPYVRIAEVSEQALTLPYSNIYIVMGLDIGGE
jgi:hypothetical protein